MVPVDSVGVSRAPTYSGILREIRSAFVYGTVTLYGWPFQAIPLAEFCNSHVKDPTTPRGKTLAVWAIPLSLAATDGIDFSFFSSRYLDVSVPWVGHAYLCIQYTLIRESRDQYSFVNYPKLFADFHALHRLLMPRHPPCALSSLTTEISNSHHSRPTRHLRVRPAFAAQTEASVPPG